MSAPLAIFFVLAGWCLVAAVAVFAVPRRRAACFAMATLWLGLTGIAAMLSAPLAAVLMVVLASACLVIAGTLPPREEGAPMSVPWPMVGRAGLGLVVVGFVVVGTVSRQIVTYGAELERVQRRLGGLRFDSMDAATSELFGRAALVPCVLGIAGLVVLVTLLGRRGS